MSVLPGAADADWMVLRKENDVLEYHAATLDLELFGTDTEAYRQGLSTREPAIYVIMRDAADDKKPLDILLVTASPFEAQDYADTGEEIVEKVAMPPALAAWIGDFIEQHHQEEVFVKRQRDKSRVDLSEDGIGDARIAQKTDVYRAPRSRERLH